MNIFCVGDFFYPLNSLNRVRICAGTPYSAPRDLLKQDRVIARFSDYSTEKKNLEIVRNFAKSCQHTIFWLFAYGAVLEEVVNIVNHAVD